jgi:aspartate aminotransferase
MRRFDQLQITYPHPQGGFYIFPDFDHYREKLIGRGIYTGRALCEKVLQETGVGMLPGVEFGRPAEEYSARIAYVDFDGTEALKQADILFVEEKCSHENFVRDYCPRIVQPIDRLGNWLMEL